MSLLSITYDRRAQPAVFLIINLQNQLFHFFLVYMRVIKGKMKTVPVFPDRHQERKKVKLEEKLAFTNGKIKAKEENVKDQENKVKDSATFSGGPFS